MGQAGRRRVLDRFTLRASVRELERVFAGRDEEGAAAPSAAAGRG
jgi:hypothetical protein